MSTETTERMRIQRVATGYVNTSGQPCFRVYGERAMGSTMAYRDNIALDEDEAAACVAAPTMLKTLAEIERLASDLGRTAHEPDGYRHGHALERAGQLASRIQELASSAQKSTKPKRPADADRRQAKAKAVRGLLAERRLTLLRHVPPAARSAPTCRDHVLGCDRGPGCTCPETLTDGELVALSALVTAHAADHASTLAQWQVAMASQGYPVPVFSSWAADRIQAELARRGITP